MKSIPSELFFSCNNLDAKDLKSLFCVNKYFLKYDTNINWCTYLKSIHSKYIENIDNKSYLKFGKHLSCTLDSMKINSGVNILNNELLKISEINTPFTNKDLFIYNLFVIICDLGYVDIAKEFIIHNESEKLFYNFESLNNATKNNNLNILKLIIESKPHNLYKGNKLLLNLSLYYSFVNNYYDIFKILFEDYINNDIKTFMFIKGNGKYGPIYGGDDLTCLMLYFHLCKDIRFLELIFNPKFKKYWQYLDWQIDKAIKTSKSHNNKMVLDFFESNKELIYKNVIYLQSNIY